MNPPPSKAFIGFVAPLMTIIPCKYAMNKKKKERKTACPFSFTYMLQMLRHMLQQLTHAP